MPEVTKISHGLTIGDLKYGNARPGVVEATLKPGETMEQALDELDERLTAWHKKRYPHLYKDGVSDWMAPTPPPENWEIQKGPPPTIQTERGDPYDTLSLIQEAPSMEALATFKIIAGADKTLYEAYCKRMKYLSA